MNLLNFISQYPNEDSYKTKLKAIREGVICHRREGILPKREPRKVGYLKMHVIPNLKAGIINEQVVSVVSDDSTSYVDLKDIVRQHQAQVIQKEKGW